MFGHMNNVSAFTYFEQARIEFLAHIGFSLEDKDIQGVPIVADLQCDFHRQIFFDEELKVYVKANHVGTSSIDIHYMVINPDRKSTRLNSSHVAISYAVFCLKKK